MMQTRSDQIFVAMRDRLYRGVNRMFVGVLLGQWALAIVLAVAISPYAYSGSSRSLHFHVVLAIVGGAVINSAPLVLIKLRPTWWGTRHTIAVAQMLWSALLIIVTGGRIETHFHVFGSLAFIAAYRDWKLLPTATVVVVIDHLARGLFWPDSVYGVANPEWWRFLEHAAWVVFEDIVLVLATVRAAAEVRNAADREAHLEDTRAAVELEVEVRTRQLHKSMAELQQAQKLESVGRLAAGIAHEINTPVQYVADSVQFVRSTLDDLLPALDHARVASDDLQYLVDNYPKALDRALDGLARVAELVKSMKVFAHPGTKEKSAIDLNAAIANTLTVARNEYKYVADLETAFGPIPLVTCHPGSINQAILNLVVNAAHAIGDSTKGSERRGTITVGTYREGADVVITITDTGTGIPESVRDHIFDPFFTTKEVGGGTGQGLAITRSVIVENHHGGLRFETEVGVGTTFYIRLPIEPHVATLAA